MGVSSQTLRKRLISGISLDSLVQKIRKDPCGLGFNRTGFRGVKKSWNKWVAQIVIDGKRKFLGTFETPELASAAYEAVRKSKNKSVEV
mgnify:CR=1 FL=1